MQFHHSPHTHTSSLSPYESPGGPISRKFQSQCLSQNIQEEGNLASLPFKIDVPCQVGSGDRSQRRYRLLNSDSVRLRQEET